MSGMRELEAVEFLLGTFFGDPRKDVRTELILKQYVATRNEYLKTFANFSESELLKYFDFLKHKLSG